MSPEEYENQISLLKEALKFYANKNNYYCSPELRSNVELGTCISVQKSVTDTMINSDKGHQARYALEQLNIVEEANKKMKEDYDKIIGDTIKAIENHPIDLTDAIKNLKDLNND